MEQRPKKLLDQVRETIGRKHYSCMIYFIYLGNYQKQGSSPVHALSRVEGYWLISRQIVS